MRTITAKKDFDRAFSVGKRAGAGVVRVVVCESPDPRGRVAFVAPKRLGNAVFRNRCKRVLRACAREAGLPAEGRDVVLLATRETATGAHGDVVRGMRRSVERATKRLERSASGTSSGA